MAEARKGRAVCACVAATIFTAAAAAAFGPGAGTAQTPLQHELREAAIAGASARSAAATPGLLSILDTKEFRGLIAGLPVANLPAAELLARWRAQVRLSPVVHNLNPGQFLNAGNHMLNDWEQPDDGDNSTHAVRLRPRGPVLVLLRPQSSGRSAPG